MRPSVKSDIFHEIWSHVSLTYLDLNLEVPNSKMTQKIQRAQDSIRFGGQDNSIVCSYVRLIPIELPLYTSALMHNSNLPVFNWH